MAEQQPMPTKKPSAPPTEAMRSPLMSLRNEIDRVFEDFLSLSPLAHWAQLGHHRGAVPTADIIEREDSYEIDIDVPGVTRDNIEIALSNQTLTVQCKSEMEKEEKGKEYYLCERRHEAFSRAFALPPNVDAEKVEADLKDGVLAIKLPKTAEARKQPRKIDVKSH